MSQDDLRFLFLDVDGVILDNAKWESESSRLGWRRVQRNAGWRHRYLG